MHAKQLAAEPVVIISIFLHSILFAFRVSESSIVLGTQLEVKVCSEQQGKDILRHTQEDIRQREIQHGRETGRVRDRETERNTDTREEGRETDRWTD